MQKLRLLGIGVYAAVLLGLLGSPARAALLPDGAIDTASIVGDAMALPSQSVQQTFSDGTFRPGDWTTVFIQGNNSIGISRSYQQAISGGDPAEYFQCSSSFVFGGTTSWVREAHFSASATFDPAQRGAITGITGGFNQGSFTKNNGFVFETGLVLQQAGTIYWPTGFWAYGLQGVTGWYGTSTLYNSIGLPSQWSAIPGTGPAQPDFSGYGAPIEFGFWTGQYYYNSGGSVVDGVDNWTVTVTSTGVPEPSSCIVVAVAMGGVMLQRRRGRQGPARRGR